MFEIKKKLDGRAWVEGGFEDRGEALEALAEWVGEGRAIGESRKGSVARTSNE